MNCHKILLQFRTLSGLDADSASDYLPLCVACAKKIENGLKADANKDDERLIFAAATSAYYQFCLIKASDMNGSADSITVGDVTQSRSYDSICKNAKILYEQALSDISDLIENSNFFFRGV